MGKCRVMRTGRTLGADRCSTRAGPSEDSCLSHGEQGHGAQDTQRWAGRGRRQPDQPRLRPHHPSPLERRNGLQRDARPRHLRCRLPDRHAQSVTFWQSRKEYLSYWAVTAFINQFLLQINGHGKASVALGHTLQQRRTASSTSAICESTHRCPTLQWLRDAPDRTFQGDSNPIGMEVGR